MKNLIAILLLLAAPAYAGNPDYVDGPDVVVVPPMPPAQQEQNWSGFYLGAHAGAAFMQQTTLIENEVWGTRPIFTNQCWKWWQQDWNRQIDDRYCSGGFDGMNQHYFDNAKSRTVNTGEVEDYLIGTETVEHTLQEDFLIYGAHGGYLLDLGDLIVGAEASYTVYNASKFDIDGIATVKGRAGLDLGRLLPYAHAGYSWAGVAEGMSYGGGVEYMLTNHLVVGAEYTHYDFADGYGHDAAVLRASWHF